MSVVTEDFKLVVAVVKSLSALNHTLYVSSY